MLGVIRLAQGRLGEALKMIARAMQARTPSPQILLNYGLVLNTLNRQQEALESFDRAIKLKSKFADAHNNRGAALVALNRHDDALEAYRKAIALRPNYPEAHYNLANLLRSQGRVQDALASYDRALALRADYVDALHNRGAVLGQLGRHEEALANYNRALALRPTYVDALNNRGTTLGDLGRFDEALASYDHAIFLQPNCAEALYNRGNILWSLQRFEEALGSYDRAILVRPDYFDALYNRGNALWELNRLDEAVESYDRALALRPNEVETLNHRGAVLTALQRPNDALASFDRGLALDPDHANTLNNRGIALQELRRLNEALASYERALAADPDHPHAFSGAAWCTIKLADWDRRTRFALEIQARMSQKSNIHPFLLLGYNDDPSLQLQCAKNYFAKICPILPRPLWTGQRWHHDKLRIAYLSADFRTHATAFLTAELFEKHDRSRFKVIGVSLGPDDGSDMRKRLVVAFDQFHDVRTQNDREIAEMLTAHEIDIAVDLNGYTQNGRIGIFAHRPAPIQVNYLGFPSTMGTKVFDYVIADPVVAPFEHQQFYAEQIVHLPECYQVNDTKRAVAQRVPTRQEAGLPERGFVFCSFNNNWKITPETFDIWMRLLHEIEGSVLWLLRDNDAAERNLRAEARQRGIDPSRLVFAGRLLTDEHLARHALADLFLDTLPCNAHTTASDALWTGLPVVTCIGNAFAGRVAASLLQATGLPELVTSNFDQYHDLALKLAREPTTLAEIKRKLANNRSSCPLFDIKRFVAHIETAYGTMWERCQRGDEPKAFSVEPIARK